MNRICIFSLLAAASALAACGPKKAQAPAMEPLPQKPAEKNWLEKTGDATWNTVSAPVKALTPKPKPKPNLQPLPPSEPPELIIVTRGSRGVVMEEPPTTAPTTQPTTAP